MKPIYFNFRDLSIKNINYWLHADNINWIPPDQWHGNRAMWDTARLVAPIQRAVARSYYVTQGNDLDEMRRKLLQEDVIRPPM